MSGISSPYGKFLRALLVGASLITLAACEEGQMPGFLQPKGDGETVARAATAGNSRTTERDVEAPEIFAAREAGLWDGRPSLGGVWVAHPDVSEPERAIIRNTSNGQFVIGALFRKERQTPGPRLQVSSDAAAAIGMLAGAPVNLDVVALRREDVADDTPEPLAAAGAIPAAPDVSEGTLDPVLDSATRALDAADGATAASVQTAALGPAANATPLPSAAAEPAAAPAPRASALSRPYIQIGIFSVEQNAKNTATSMRQAGLIPTIKPGESSGKPFWRVVVGPAQTSDERAMLLKTIKGNGFEDAYAVTD